MTFDPIIFLALTQLILEALPISSSGHVRLVQALCARNGIMRALPESIDHLLHGPMLCIIAWYFRAAWWQLLRNSFTTMIALMRNGFVVTKLKNSQQRLLILVAKILGMIFVADGITTCLYGLIKILLRNVIQHNSLILLAIGFAITMILLLSDWWFNRRTHYTTMSFPMAAIIGFVQGIIFLLPGISRFAVTVMLAKWLGLSPRRALQWSFLLFSPLMLAAFVGHGVPVMAATAFWAKISVPLLTLLGGTTALAYILFAYAARATLRNRLWLFGLYMIIPISIAVWFAFF